MVAARSFLLFAGGRRQPNRARGGIAWPDDENFCAGLQFFLLITKVSSTLSDYDYVLPRELIAQRPLPRRDESRMMVLNRKSQTVEHRSFRDLTSFLGPGELLVLNDTRVLPAQRFAEGGKIEILFVKKLGPARWKCLTKPGRKMRKGTCITIDGVTGQVVKVESDGSRTILLDKDIDVYASGSMPLPPYIDRLSDAEDEARYQTAFARSPGAIAAPTAGLHFTPEILGAVAHTFITLDVGIGTFRPVLNQNIAEHQMDPEQFAISEEAAGMINKAQRITAVGTTTTRVLESAKRCHGQIVAQTGSTNIFIYPPFHFQVIDALLTNFHLPRSTLLMLVSAFAGREFILQAYEEAIRRQYRFYSYGDCMLVL
jgi:S-adenosylmethionine:tRNA ribosyltransferase-isomerase